MAIDKSTRPLGNKTLHVRVGHLIGLRRHIDRVAGLTGESIGILVCVLATNFRLQCRAAAFRLRTLRSRRIACRARAGMRSPGVLGIGVIFAAGKIVYRRTRGKPLHRLAKLLRIGTQDMGLCGEI